MKTMAFILLALSLTATNLFAGDALDERAQSILTDEDAARSGRLRKRARRGGGDSGQN